MSNSHRRLVALTAALGSVAVLAVLPAFARSSTSESAKLVNVS